MYLKSLTLKGFKSFADRTVMRFEPGVAAVVGPNGSGKSNISDAVLWVLGERNAKNLRGQSMEDVIFSGSSARKPVSVAEVELLLDNSDGTLPVDFAEVSIGRRMYRSGESEYLINGNVVRRMDVLDVLHDSGLGTGTNSIISQGNLDSVLSSKPEDRRALIEEAAGILKHKERKAKSERKLAQMDNHLARVNDIAAEVERQLKPLERKARKAHTYQQLSAELAEVRLDLAVDDMHVLQDRWNKTLEQESALSAQETAVQERLKAAEEHLDKVQQRLQERDSTEQEVQQSFQRIQAAYERLSSTAMLLQEKRNGYQAEAHRLEQSLEQGRLRQSETEQELMSARASVQDARTSHDQANRRCTELEHQYRDRVAQRKELRRELDTLSAEQRSLIHQQETIQASRDALRNKLAEKHARAEVITAQVEEITKRLEGARQQAATVQDQAQGLAQQVEEATNAEFMAREKLAQCRASREDARNVLDTTRNAFTQATAERAALEELERASEASNAVLSAALDRAQEQQSAIALLSHVVSVPEGYEQLIEAVIDTDVQAILTRDSASAHRVLEHVLQGNEVGCLTVMDDPSRAFSCESYQSVFEAYPAAVAGCTRLITDIVVEDPYRTQVELLLGNVYVADTLKQAQEACEHALQHMRDEYKGALIRIVTRDGFVVSTDGKTVFRRLSEADKKNSALARRRALQEARTCEIECEGRYREACDTDVQEEEALRIAQTEALTASEQLAHLRGQERAFKSEVRHATEQVTLLEAEHKRLMAEQQENQAFLEKSQPDVDTFAHDLARIQADLAHNEEQRTQLEESLSPLQKEIVSLSDQVSESRLEVARLSERLSYAQRMVAAHEQEIASVSRSDEQARERSLVAQGSMRRASALLAAIQTLSTSAARVLKRLESDSREAQEHSRALHDSIAQATQASRAISAEAQQISSSLNEVRVEKGRLEVQVENGIKVIVEECATPLDEALMRQPLDDRNEAEQRLGALERRIKNMGTINPDAAEEFEQVSERYQYLSAQLEDMRLARRALSRIVSVIDDRMRNDFERTFNQVNDNFSEIFSTLFPGGQAHLSFTDPDDLENTGVDVNAQPVGKRVKKMSLLSGGEKSMTAMALLFAVYRIRQTPFYILDEVEAALDDTNLRRLLSYLDTIRQHTQFIMITHQRRTMESADILYGVSMQADGVTKVLSQKLDNAMRKEG